MDAWSGDQLRKMQLGGNDSLNTFLKKYGVDKFTDIKEKYSSQGAEVRFLCWICASLSRSPRRKQGCKDDFAVALIVWSRGILGFPARRGIASDGVLCCYSTIGKRSRPRLRAGRM